MGQIVKSVWCSLPEHFSNIHLDEYVIMPNHFHGILQNDGSVVAKVREKVEAKVGAKVGAKQVVSASPHLQNGTTTGSFSSIIQNFKSVSTRKINKFRSNPGCPAWQRNFYERVLRNENELFRAREYIANNPMQWELDKENPTNCR